MLFQEFGLPARPAGTAAPGVPPADTELPSRAAGRVELFTEAEGADFYRDALAELRREAFLGAFAWCANDYAEHLWTRPPLADNVHERFFGLFRADGSAKAAVEVWRELEAAPEPSLGARGTDWIDIDQQRFWVSPLQELRRLYPRFLSL